MDNYDYFSGQPDELKPAIITDEDEQILTVIETNDDTNSGERKGPYFIVNKEYL